MKNRGTTETARLPASERFWSRVTKDRFVNPQRPELGYCWLYEGALQQGYGQFGVGRKSVRAHRFAYEEIRGSIPEGLSLDHLCYTRNCVNPDHLEPVTPSENTQRARGKAHYIVIFR